MLFFPGLLFWPGDIRCQRVDSVIIEGIQNRVSLEEYLTGNRGFSFFYADSVLNGIYVYETDNGKLLRDYLNETLPQKMIIYLVYKERNLVFIDRSKLENGKKDNSLNVDIYNVVDVGDPLLAGKYKKGLLQGYVRNGKTGEPLPGAVIHFPSLETGIVTNMSGYYSIEIPAGNQEVTYSYVGFEGKELTVNMISPGNLNIELFESTIALDQVVITSKSDANVVGTEMGIIRLDARTISTIPVLMGEPDLIKTMTLLPGIQSSGDLASGFNVRGGNTDQNLILLDDVPVYNPNHLFGMFSIIDTRAINNLELYKGGAPSRFGGRASAFLDISLKEGNLKKWEGSGSAGLFSSKLTLEGPVVKEKASVIISGRTTYSDWLLKNIPDAEIRKSEADFYDFTLKLNITLNRKNRLSLFAYTSNDYFNLADRNSFKYANTLASLRWGFIGSEKFTFFLNAFMSDYQTFSVEKHNPINAFSLTTGLRQFGTKYRILFSISKNHSLEGGIEGNYFIFYPGSREPYGDESDKNPLSLEQEQSAELAGFIQDNIKIGDRLSLFAGLRYTHYAYVGPATVNLYETENNIDNTSLAGTRVYEEWQIIKNYSGLEPRLGMRFSIGTGSSLKLGASRNFQFMHILSNSTVIIPSDSWKPSDNYILPSKGDQISIGYFRNFRKGVFETSAEIYYKKVHNMLEYKNGAELLLNDAIEQDVLPSDLEAYGIELLFRRNAGRLTGWVSYTYSRSFLKTQGSGSELIVPDGKNYPAYFDKPHDLSVVTSYKLSRRFTVSSSFTYNTGRPATYPESGIMIDNNYLVRYSERNKYRLRDYHRLDLSISWDTSLKRKKKYYSNWVLSVFNVYGRNNVYSTYYKKDIPTAKNDYKKYAFYELSIIGSPIPSLTYNLRF